MGARPRGSDLNNDSQEGEEGVTGGGGKGGGQGLVERLREHGRDAARTGEDDAQVGRRGRPAQGRSRPLGVGLTAGPEFQERGGMEGGREREGGRGRGREEGERGRVNRVRIRGEGGGN